MMKKVTFTIHRSGWTQYEAEVSNDFDTSDFAAMLELADDPETEEVDGDTSHLSVFVGDREI